MDMEKLKQWLDMAKTMQGGDFWGNIFDQEFAKQFINSEQYQAPFSTSNRQTPGNTEPPKTFPLIDLIEGEEEIIITIELPGVMKENVQLGLQENILTVKGKVLPIHPNGKTNYSERFYGDFQRQITLPDSVSPNDLNAKFWNGLLIVRYERSALKGEMIPID